MWKCQKLKLWLDVFPFLLFVYNFFNLYTWVVHLVSRKQYVIRRDSQQNCPIYTWTNCTNGKLVQGCWDGSGNDYYYHFTSLSLK